MVNIVCVKYGTKYTASHVNRLYEMVRRNTSLPFLFYCLTDNGSGLHPDIIVRDLDLNLDLESFWYKFCIFDSSLYLDDVPTFYFDLDIIIQNNIDHLFNHPEKNIKISYSGELKEPDSLKWPTAVNSSMMLFIPSKTDYIREGFIKNPDYNIIQYGGVCRYLWQIHKEELDFFIPMKDYYSFIRVPQIVKDMGDPHKKYRTKERFVNIDYLGRKVYCSGYYIPHLPICILNGCSEAGILDQVYEFFSNYHK